ncbi:MAG: Gfo/Idh/MocA family protein [Christensenellales bacterium]
MKDIGLIGCGAWGKNILRDLCALHCKVHVADTDESARQRALTLGAADICAAYTALPACDGYVVAVPIPDLSKVCAGLLPQKKPIFSEKTLCMSMEDYETLKKLGGSDYLFVMHKWHYHNGIETLRRIAQSGMLGELEEIHTIRHAWVDDFHGGDVFFTQAVHDLTIIKHLLGTIPDSVQAVHVIRNADGLAVSLTAMIGGNPSVLLSVSGRHTSKKSGVSIHGSKGCAELSGAYDSCIAIKSEEGERSVAFENTMPLYLELKEFIDFLHGGPKPRCGLEEAGEVTKAILRLKQYA